MLTSKEKPDDQIANCTGHVVSAHRNVAQATKTTKIRIQSTLLALMTVPNGHLRGPQGLCRPLSVKGTIMFYDMIGCTNNEQEMWKAIERPLEYCFTLEICTYILWGLPSCSSAVLATMILWTLLFDRLPFNILNTPDGTTFTIFASLFLAISDITTISPLPNSLDFYPHTCSLSKRSVFSRLFFLFLVVISVTFCLGTRNFGSSFAATSHCIGCLEPMGPSLSTDPITHANMSRKTKKYNNFIIEI